MNLRDKILNPACPLVFYELIPPKLGDSAELERLIETCRALSGKVDAINIPEIVEETRWGAGGKKTPERLEPRRFGSEIQSATGLETIINRITVRESEASQRKWLQECYQDYAIRNLILVGGESSDIPYPGPSVEAMAKCAREEKLDFLLGGITIPSRSREGTRIRDKHQQGVAFFTTQVLLDSNDIVDLIQDLNGIDVRIMLSLAPVSNVRDLQFLKHLGVDVPNNVMWAIEQAGGTEKALEKSIALATGILTDVFNNLPEHPPALGINIEQITRRNFHAALQLLEQIAPFYRRHVQARFPAEGSRWQSEHLFGPARRDRSSQSAE
ncbi:MAG: hypothetical protein A3F68_09065 [Acidobacteria bacterium RIFCSPLOWO2_12_FULL_54_10]|nr:MAG: hypothetical protein A3F68_09065 [Acidobacteria bacterium RIFCSPLOWO2_12_FULL_54_10]